MASPMVAQGRIASAPLAKATVIVEVEQSDGLVGVGASTGGEAACFVIEQHLAMFVEGQSASNVWYIWEQLFRASIHVPGSGARTLE